YSLTSPELLVTPDPWLKFWSPRRLILMGQWDDTPHFLALALLPLVILGLTYAIRTRRLLYIAASALAIAIMTAASAFGLILPVLAAICLVATLGRNHLRASVLTVAMVGVWAYAMSAAFLPPSLLRAMHASASPFTDSFWITNAPAQAIVAAGWVLAWYLCRRWTQDWRVQFFWLFAYLMCSIPMLGAYAHMQALPQPERYRIEAGLGLTPILAFAVRGWVIRWRKSPAVIGVLLATLAVLAAVQIDWQRKFAAGMWPKTDVAQTVEYRASSWIAANLPGVRVFLPGSIAQWADTFADIQQFSGGSWSVASNRAQQTAFRQILNGTSEVALAWLRAYGVGAVVVSDAKSAEYWKPFSQPAKFEGLLPVLWRSEGVTIYRVPANAASLAHVIPADSVVSLLSIDQLMRYDDTLADPALPVVALHWPDRNSILLKTDFHSGQAISLQVNQQPGWRATANGRACPIRRDQLGLMLLTPLCNGPCEIALYYDGGLEIRLARLVTWISLAGCLVCLAPVFIRKFRFAVPRPVPANQAIPQQRGAARFLLPSLLVLLNLYFCHELFSIEYLVWFNSIEAAYISLTRYISQNWADLTWFPLWYGGIPFQNTYPPLLHVATAAMVSLTRLSPARSHHVVTAALFCLGPLTLYGAVRQLTKSVWAAFWAGLVYSVLSPCLWLLPTAYQDFHQVWGLRRLQVMVFYGEGPHITSLVFLPPAIWALDLARERRTPLSHLIAALAFAAVVLSNWLGAFALALLVFAWMVAFPSAWRSVAIAATLAYAFAAPWLPPSTVADIQRNARFVEGDYSAVYARLPWVVAGALVLALLIKLANRWIKLSPAALFLILSTLLITTPPLLNDRFGIALIPQPHRYQLELDMVLATCVGVAGWAVFRWHRRAMLFGLVALVLAFLPAKWGRHATRPFLRSATIKNRIEYQTAGWLEQNAPTQRVFVPASESSWLNAFTDNPQLGGGFDQGIVNPFLRHVIYQVYAGALPSAQAGPITLLWLRAFGITILGVGGPNSRADAKPFQELDRFASLPELRRDGDDILYQVSQPTSLAGVLSPQAVVSHTPENGVDIPETRRYVEALDSSRAHLHWTSRHSAMIDAELRSGEVISFQETYHPGWHAICNGASCPIGRDGLDQMILEPKREGACHIDLFYDGGWEMLLVRLLRGTALILWAIWFSLPSILKIWQKQDRSSMSAPGIRSGPNEAGGTASNYRMEPNS
ncbi:MAG TPA: hypothetical protein VKG25_19055, partial [Bryobacteraceae bacterium]|nr:hypothetical protein [Bryobacteraceae bacterium]